jgi:hypothetical protein
MPPGSGSTRHDGHWTAQRSQCRAFKSLVIDRHWRSAPDALTNGPGSGQIAILGPRSGCSAAWIGILGILRRPASWRGATTIITSRKLKSPFGVKGI